MSLYASTISNVLQIISDYRGETVTNTDSNRVRAVSRQERALARRRLWRLFHLKDQTMSGDGTNDYTIGDATNPYRNKGLSELFVSSDGTTNESSRYAIVDYNNYKKLYNEGNATQMVYEWYDSDNDVWKLHINPAPTATDTITYSYFWLPPERSSASDTVYTVNVEALARYALADLFASEDEDDLANEQRAIAEQIIAEEMGWENSPAINQSYMMGSIENSDMNRGLGNY